MGTELWNSFFFAKQNQRKYIFGKRICSSGPKICSKSEGMLECEASERKDCIVFIRNH